MASVVRDAGSWRAIAYTQHFASKDEALSLVAHLSETLESGKFSGSDCRKVCQPEIRCSRAVTPMCGSHAIGTSVCERRAEDLVAGGLGQCLVPAGRSEPESGATNEVGPGDLVWIHLKHELATDLHRQKRFFHPIQTWTQLNGESTVVDRHRFRRTTKEDDCRLFTCPRAPGSFARVSGLSDRIGVRRADPCEGCSRGLVDSAVLVGKHGRVGGRR